MQNNNPTKSPLSKLKPIKVIDLPRNMLLSKLSEYFNQNAPIEIVDGDYSLWRCSQTGLEFSWPMQPGNSSFYEWISSFPSYYPYHRWEYDIVANRLKKMQSESKNYSILDVGCGSGTFLGELDFLDPVNIFGIDFNAPAIRECERKGIQAFCGSLNMGLQSGFIKSGQFQVVTSFHCLEHVPNPEEFVRELINVTSDAGSIFLSTPASPMSFEVGWFDVMNHPPHHMTRWNLQAYKQLAENLGMKIKHTTRSVNVIKKSLQLEELKAFGPNRRKSAAERMLRLCKHLPDFLESLWKLQKRAWHDPLRGADVILIELTKK
jgi:2-polyprenyl-3-methyl-5-hydroxy-6-metoxy-1,4-benzoquinol methylase